MNPQKAFMREYKLAVLDAAECVLDKITSTASRKDYEPDIFLDNVLQMVRKLANKEDV